jgi:SAM-dependent methyltransferase
LGELGVACEKATFVDLGAGKGRALLIAARSPFRELVGVEYSATLAATARANVQRAGDDRIRIVHADAASYRFPDGPLVLYFYNPFDATVMREVIWNLTQSHQHQRRRIVVLYFLPRPSCLELWERASFLHFAGTIQGAAVYDTDMTGTVPASASPRA